MIQDTIELMRRMSAYAIRVAMLSRCQYMSFTKRHATNLLPHFPPQEPMTALHVAAPQQEAATLHTCRHQHRAVTCIHPTYRAHGGHSQKRQRQ